MPGPIAGRPSVASPAGPIASGPGPSRSRPPSHRAADPAVLPDPPEVDHDQQRRRQRDRHAVQHVEPVQRHLADAPAAQQGELGVRARRDQAHPVELQERRTRPLDPHAAAWPGPCSSRP